MFVECLNGNGLHASEEIARNVKESLRHACFKDGKLCAELEPKDINSFLDVLKHYFVFSRETNPFNDASYSISNGKAYVEAVGLEEKPLQFDFGNFSGMRLINNENRDNEKDVFVGFTFVLLLIIKDDINEGMKTIRFVDFNSDMSQAFTVNGLELFREFFSKELNGNYRDSHVDSAYFGLVRQEGSSVIKHVIENIRKEYLTRIEGVSREEEAFGTYTEEEVKDGPLKCKALSTKVKSLSSHPISPSKETLIDPEQYKELNILDTTANSANELTKKCFETAINITEEFKRAYFDNLEGTLGAFSVLHNVKESLSSNFNSAILNQGFSYATSSFFEMKKSLTKRNLKILKSLNMIEVYGKDIQQEEEVTTLNEKETSEISETTDLKKEEAEDSIKEHSKEEHFSQTKDSSESKEGHFSQTKDSLEKGYLSPEEEEFFSPNEDAFSSGEVYFSQDEY